MADAVREMADRCRNWGKWGAEDELGTLNYITPQKVVEAAQLARRGKVFSLSIPFDDKGPQIGRPGRFNPIHRMILSGADFASGAKTLPGGVGFADDMIIMPLQCATQWDGLAHCFLDGKMYNGYDQTLVASDGAKKNGIEKMQHGVVTRGVLLDLPRVKGVDWLKRGHGISAADLDEALAVQKVSVGKGDALIIRTGAIAECRALGEWGDYAGGNAAGMSIGSCAWLHEREIAALALDTWGMEVRPNEIEGTFQPVHQILLPAMGLLVGEIFDLEALAEDCAKDRVYEFLFTAPPLPITGAVGSPINPLAVK